MPFVNIKITKEKGEPTLKQKQELIEGITELLAKVLNKNSVTVALCHALKREFYILKLKDIK